MASFYADDAKLGQKTRSRSRGVALQRLLDNPNPEKVSLSLD
jgi:hypothetical protein